MLRKICSLTIAFFIGAFLGKPLALGLLGLCIKIYLLIGSGWQFSYGSIDWHDGKLLLSEIDLVEINSFHLHANRCMISLNQRHLDVLQPQIVIFKIPDQRGANEWTCTMEDGVLLSKDIGEMHFAFEKNWPQHIGRISLSDGSSKMQLEATREGEELQLNVNLDQFDLRYFQRWMKLHQASFDPHCMNEIQGQVDGTLHLIFEGTECKRGGAHLTIHGGAYGEVLSGLHGQFDWDGSASLIHYMRQSKQNANGCWFDHIGEVHFRLHLLDGIARGMKGAVHELQGTLHFTAGVGVKWDFEGQALARGSRTPLSWNGRAFLHPGRPCWVESEMSCSDAQFLLNGSEEQDGFHWIAEAHRIGSTEGALLQSLFACVDARFGEVEFEEGQLNARLDARIAPEQTENRWDAVINAKDCLVCHGESQFQLCSGQGSLSSHHAGSFLLDGASFKIQLAEDYEIKGDSWRGEGRIESGKLSASEWMGRIEGIDTVAALSGSLDDFHLVLSGNGGELILKGMQQEDHLEFMIEKGEVEGFCFHGHGWLDRYRCFFLQFNQFSGPCAPLYRITGRQGMPQFKIQSIGSGFIAEGDLESFDWSLQARGEFESGINFYCPHLEKKENLITFDMRFENPLFEFLRLYGSSSGEEWIFDPIRTHLLGAPLRISTCLGDSQGLSKLQFQTELSYQPLSVAAAFWFPQAVHWNVTPFIGDATLDFCFTRGEEMKVLLNGDHLLWNGEAVAIHLTVIETDGIWDVSKLQVNDCLFSGKIKMAQNQFQLFDGNACWKDKAEAFLTGTLSSDLQGECFISSLHFDLSSFTSFPFFDQFSFVGLQGVVEGSGSLFWKERMEADFDFAAFRLDLETTAFQSKEPIHLHYTSDSGFLCRGIDLCVSYFANEIAAAPLIADPESHEDFVCKTFEMSCKIGLLQYDLLHALLMLQHADIQFSAKNLALFAPQLAVSDLTKEFAFSADLECPLDFSYLTCFVKEGAFPFRDSVYFINDLSFFCDSFGAKAIFYTVYQGHGIKIGAYVLSWRYLTGRFTFEDTNHPLKEKERPLSIDWTYSFLSGLKVHEIEGQFGGIDAAFHGNEQGTSLIGSMRLHFDELVDFVPPALAELFCDLKMGKGYELKGQLHLAKEGPSFHGLLSGKQFDLFGYQLRTLLAQIELGSRKVKIYDFKISDSAGVMKIDEIVAATAGDDPWTLSIPHLTLLELRPSLLQRPGPPPEEAGPLVVRELKLENFHGLLEDSYTYTAQGELKFINSYRREHTVFDIPSDFLGRIAGLDLELLIPACGTLRYELKDRRFHLVELSESYSEAKRSQFFLVHDPPPSMDLDGNLMILVKMKQFVLFKFTESFLISIDGQLNDPQFHLQKKSRFLGL